LPTTNNTQNLVLIEKYERSTPAAAAFVALPCRIQPPLAAATAPSFLPSCLLLLSSSSALLSFLLYSLPFVNHPAIQAGSLPVSQAANLPGYYEIPNKI
jgi:hypothetical protein